MPIVDHIPELRPLPKVGTVWRFMSISKLIGMLDASAITFAQLGLLSRRDPYEGRWSNSQQSYAKRIEQDDDFACMAFELLKTAEPEHQDISRAKKIGLARSALGLQRLLSVRELNLSTQYISCWYVGEHEPAGMWSAYASEDDGVAVRSSIGRIRSSLSRSQEPIVAAMISYEDFIQNNSFSIGGNIFDTVFKKRVEYENEREMRLCYWANESINGLQQSVSLADMPEVHNIDCNLGVLIQELRVAPFAGTWVIDALQNVLSKYDVSSPVTRSSLC